jgi:hypothetical protein
VIRRIWHDHGLSIVLIGLFLFSFIGQIWSGWHVYNEDQVTHGQPAVPLADYLRSGHFGEATFENWESEFLQMAFYVLLTIGLYQIGSSESKRPGVIELVDLDPRESPQKDKAPWPVRKGGFALRLYENSLSIAFATLFVASLALHGVSGVVEFNEERASHGEARATTLEYMASSTFWFESFQNWQSEFLSLAAMVGFSIFLRQNRSTRRCGTRLTDPSRASPILSSSASYRGSSRSASARGSTTISARAGSRSSQARSSASNAASTCPTPTKASAR